MQWEKPTVSKREASGISVWTKKKQKQKQKKPPKTPTLFFMIEN